VSALPALRPAASRAVAGRAAAAQWAQIRAVAPQVAATIQRYLQRLAAFLAPGSVDAADNALRQFARWMITDAGVRINLSTMVIGVLARDSETRHAVGAENEIPDISEYSGGQAGYFGIWSVRQKKYLQRGRSFYIGKLGEQRDKIISKRDPAARPVLQDTSQIEVTAPVTSWEQPGSGLRERLAHVRQLNDRRPPGPASTGPLPVVPGVPPEVMAVLHPILASGRTSAAAVGLRLGVSKTTAHGYLAAMRQYGIAEVTGSGRSSGWQLTQRPQMPEPMREPPGQYATTAQYATLEDLAQAVHDGLVDADKDARTVLEQVRWIAGRKRLSAVPDPPGDGQ